MQAAVSSSVTFVCQIYSANPGRGSGQHLPSMLRFYASCCTVGGNQMLKFELRKGSAFLNPSSVHVSNSQVVMENGLVNFTLSSPQGMVTGNQYNGKDKVLGRRSGKPEDRGGKCGISIMLRGCSGFSSYGIFEHQEGCPDVNIYQGSILFKLEERL
ncbi:hypothetical protein Vadar_006023 [Vaccinium darrowii]|uniref:Uncharacterized protein n=1 Tax=Vaccinium darrowii TaxID=229202 RepID=A0ACB7WYC5_9ERIC|nr:hypothetical protein Vadar_006023 [Vaccinium darrowii]